MFEICATQYHVVSLYSRHRQTDIYVLLCVSYLRDARFVLIKPMQSLQCHFDVYTKPLNIQSRASLEL